MLASGCALQQDEQQARGRDLSRVDDGGMRIDSGSDGSPSSLDDGGAQGDADGSAAAPQRPRDAGGADASDHADARVHADGDDAGDGGEPVDGSVVDPALAQWTGGHGDLGFAFRSDDGTLYAFVRLADATVDGAAGVTADFPPDELLIRSTATFSRPHPDDGAFAPLCVEPGQEAGWLPQRNHDASAAGAPFVGLLAEVEPGTFMGDQLVLELTAVRSPSGTGAYSLWRDGFPPAFYFASCDGIDAADALPLPIGHDHFNMAFSEPGLWQVEYRVSGQLAADGATLATDVTVRYSLE